MSEAGEFGLVPEPYREWLTSQPDLVNERYSYSFADGPIDMHTGRAPERSVARERQNIERYLQWNAQEFPQYAKLVNTILSEPKTERIRRGVAGAAVIGRADISEMDEECRYSVFIPARYEEQSIYQALSGYAKQQNEDGSQLDSRTWEINVLVNFADGERPDNTYEEVMRFKRDNPHVRCNVVELMFQKPWASAGFARKLASDLTLVRANNRGNGYRHSLFLESQDADLPKVDPHQVSKSLRMMREHPELDAVVGHTEMTPEQMVQNDFVFVQRRFWDFARAQTNKYVYKIPPGDRDFHSTRIWTFGTSTTVSAESLALIGGYNWDTKVGEDLDIGHRLSLLRGRKIKDRFVPNLHTVGHSGTRTNTSPRRYYWGAFKGAGSEYANFDDQTVRQMSLQELQEKAPYKRIGPDNVKRFERMFYYAYEQIRYIVPDQKLSEKIMRRTLVWLGFKPGDFVINGNQVRIHSTRSIAATLEENRQRVLGKKAPKKVETPLPTTERYEEVIKERRRISEQLINSRATMQETLESFDNDWTPLEHYYRRRTGSELVHDPVRSLETEIPITKSMSVVIPVYKKMEDVTIQLQALAASSFARKYPGQFEVILVDDGSPEGDIVRAVRDANIDNLAIRVYRQDNSGKVGALYTGIQKAKGDIVLTLDPDYLPLPDSIMELMKRHEVLDDVLLLGFREDIDRGTLQQRGVERVLQETVPDFTKDVRLIGDNVFDQTKWFKTAGYNRPIYDGHTRMRISSFSHEVVRSAPREAMLRAMGGYVPGETINPGDEILCHRLQAQGLYVIPVPSVTGLHIEHTSNYNAERSKRRREIMRTLAAQPMPPRVKNPYHDGATKVLDIQPRGRQPQIIHTKVPRAIETSMMYVSAGLYGQAAQHAQQAIEIDPTSPRAHAVRSIALLNAGDVNGARKAAAEAWKYGNEHPMTDLARGMLFAHEGQWQQAGAMMLIAAVSDDEQARILARLIMDVNGKDRVIDAQKSLREAEEQPLRRQRALWKLRAELMANPNNAEAQQLYASIK